MKSTPDRYYSAHLAALGTCRVEIGVLDMVRDKMQLRAVNVDEMSRYIGWLKYQNTQGFNIYVRPVWPHTMTLVDDLTDESILMMQAEGFEPSFIVETSPGNFQAWLDNGVEMDQRVATRVARLIALRFGADANSADWRHLGRLAGFTNRKPKYRDTQGRFPYVRVHSVDPPSGGYAAAAEIRAEAENQLAAELLELEQRRRAMAAAGAAASRDALPIARFWRDGRYDGDYTRADLAYAIHALGRGLSEAAVRASIAGRDLSHKGSLKRQDDYIERTLAKARQFLDS